MQTTTNTVDGDDEADFIIGAPGYDATQNAARANAGGALIVQGGLITVRSRRQPGTVQIGVGTPVRAVQHQRDHAGQPCRSTSSARRPPRPTSCRSPISIPTTVKVNGVAFPNATISKTPTPARTEFPQRHPGRHHHDQPAVGAEPGQRRRHDHDHRPDARHLAAAQLHLDGHGHGHRHRRLGHSDHCRWSPASRPARSRDRRTSRRSGPTSIRRRSPRFRPSTISRFRLRRPCSSSCRRRASASGSTATTTPARRSGRT